MDWLNQILQGVLLGGYYALIACGLSLMFGVLRVINLAHGSLAVVAAYLLWQLAEQWEISPFLGLLIVVPVMALLGWLLHSRYWNAVCVRANWSRCLVRSALLSS